MSVSYTPAPYEQAYYDGLFQAADVNRQGVLGGAESVGFFSRSKLNQDMLKNVWTLADQNPTNGTLDRRKFATAVRLIQLSQNGQKAQGANLEAPPGVTLRPAFFEGVSGTSVALPQASPQQPMRAPTTPPMQQQPYPQGPPSPGRPPMQQQQQHYPQGPPSPGRPPMPQQQSTMSMALTTQDPYSMPPQEQARYEGLFPQYDKGDGYVYGQEAVALFSKSGLPQPVLRDIWNMVDTPVDNRLDKLEFAMAMHLIVCVSKKNLPVPQALPVSLKALKSQRGMSAAGSPPMRTESPAMSGGPPSMPQMMGSSASVGSAPPIAPQAMGSSMSATGMSGGGGPPHIHSSPPAEIHSVPPIQKPGGMSISDAFEGLDGPGMGPSMMGASHMSGGPPPIYGGSLASASFEQPPVPAVEIPEPEASAPEPSPAPSPVMQARPKTTKELASSYNMGDEATELEKLKTMLQRLQAENISLKASLGSMTEEEREVQKEISATVAEIGKLSSTLTTLREQVLRAKSALLEATAELKGHKEKKSMITDLITETEATHEAINSALDSVHEAAKANEEQTAAAAQPVMEADLFTWDSPEKTAPTQSEQPPVTTVSTPEDEDEPEQHDHYDYNAGAMAFGAPPAAHERSFGAPPPPAQEDGAMGAASEPAPAPSPAIPPKTFENEMPSAGAPTVADLESLKESARLAEQAAQEAEANRRNLAQQADDLRRIADLAEEESRDKEAHASKRGFGPGKRKKMREIEKAKQDAAEKQRQFMDIQTQANNAQALALETRREADRLREKAEQAEIQAAQAASMEETQQRSYDHMVAPMPVPVPATNGGYNGAHHQKEPSYGGFGDGYGIMGGSASNDGGFGIPTPPGSSHGGFGY